MYFVIGISLLFAVLFGVNFAASAVAAASWRLIAKTRVGQTAKTRSSLIFGLRVMPLVAASILIFAFILPSYLVYEPESSGETVGFKLAVLTFISAAGLIAAICRIFASWWRTRRLIADWLSRSEPIAVAGSDIPTYLLRHPFPIIAVVGVFRPKLFVAAQILTELNEQELAAAISHERGHLAAHDNFKRMVMRICGDLVLLPMGRTLDRLWSEAVETAADEYSAARGGAMAALDLASALVKIGRVTPVDAAWSLPSVAFLIEGVDGSLAARIDHLLEMADSPQGVAVSAAKRNDGLIWAGMAVVTAILLPLALNSHLLASVHSMSEAFLAILQ